MSSIPYNYGKYIDDKVSMTNSGTVDADRQVQSPASAGSRGLAKTTQFTKDRTQMKMGNTTMSESMVEIRNILNRIDGVNVPVQEAPKDRDIDYTKLMLQISAMKDKIAELPIDDDRKTSALTALGQVEDDLAMDESAVKEDAELTDEQEKGLEAIAKKYKDREGGNGDELARGHIKALTSSGITTDGFDVEEMEAYAKKIGKDWPEWEDEIDDFLKQAPITSGMMDDMNKVLGPDWEQNEKLSAAAADVLDKSAGFVPMPEADEFDIEEDEDFEEVLGPLGFPEDELWEAEYRGRKVPLNKPMRGDVKKFKVYVKDPKTGNVKKVNFGHGGTSAKKLGQKTMKIRRSNPKARKSFRARHNCANPGPKTKARYWSCRKW
jgi:hypothetical protein